MSDERIVGKSGYTSTRAKAMISTDHYHPAQHEAEVRHMRRTFARIAAEHPDKWGRRPFTRKTTPSRYGPHRPEDAPQTVTIFRTGTDDERAPIPDELVRQRELLNTLAARPA